MLKKENLREISKKLVANRVDYLSAFRENVNKYIDDKEITLVGLARAATIPVNTLNTFVYGKSKDMRLSNVVKIAHALEISLDELVGAETIPEQTRESVRLCRNLPENDLYLVRWFIRYLGYLNSKTEPNKRYISVMLPTIDNSGNLKIASNYEKIDVSNLEESISGKVFFGVKLGCENYMPHYTPNDILLLANDRPPKPTENCIVRIGKFIYLAKQKIEHNTPSYYSIRDGKYRFDASGIDELIGYIAKTIHCTKGD